MVAASRHSPTCVSGARCRPTAPLPWSRRRVRGVGCDCTRGAGRGRSTIWPACPMSSPRPSPGCASTGGASSPSAAAWAGRRRSWSSPAIRRSSPAQPRSTPPLTWRPATGRFRSSATARRCSVSRARRSVGHRRRRSRPTPIAVPSPGRRKSHAPACRSSSGGAPAIASSRVRTTSRADCTV